MCIKLPAKQHENKHNLIYKFVVTTMAIIPKYYKNSHTLYGHSGRSPESLSFHFTVPPNEDGQKRKEDDSGNDR